MPSSTSPWLSFAFASWKRLTLLLHCVSASKEMVDVIASWLPGRRLIVLGASAYMGQKLLKGLPQPVKPLGPIHKKAVLTEPLAPGADKRRKKGEYLTTPQEAFDDVRWPWQELEVH